MVYLIKFLVLISIPFSTIKSGCERAAADKEAAFQFHLVRLKDHAGQHKKVWNLNFNSI